VKVAQLLETRRQNWQQLERLCDVMESSGRRKLRGGGLTRFAALYRAACADLALADSYQLPPGTVQYLHRLVGRAHNQLYRSRTFQVRRWGERLLVDAPRQIFHDRCVQFAFVLFWLLFIGSAYMALSPEKFPGFLSGVVPEEMIAQMEMMYEDSPSEQRDEVAGPLKTSFYIWNNTSIGLRCFVYGLLIIPGIYEMCFNAVFLGTIFGYMARDGVYVKYGTNFFEFVTAHGPFELTAVALSAGGGLRLGVSLLITRGLSRLASVQKAALESLLVIFAAVILFVLAAFVEGFVSPSRLPYAIKATVAIISSGLLTFYFVILGFPAPRQLQAEDAT